MLLTNFYIRKCREWWWGMSEKAAKPVTTVQNCVSTFVSVKLVDIFKEKSGKFPSMKV